MCSQYNNFICFKRALNTAEPFIDSVFRIEMHSIIFECSLEFLTTIFHSASISNRQRCISGLNPLLRSMLFLQVLEILTEV